MAEDICQVCYEYGKQTVEIRSKSGETYPICFDCMPKEKVSSRVMIIESLDLLKVRRERQ